MSGTTTGTAIGRHDRETAAAHWEPLVTAIAQQTHQAHGLAGLWPTAVAAVQQRLGCDRVLLYQLGPDGGRVVAEACSDQRWSLLDRVDACFETAWLDVYQAGQVRAIADVATADLPPCHASGLADLAVNASLTVPVLCASQLWGLLIAHGCGAPRPWAPADIDGLERLALQIGIALRQAELEALVATRTHELAQANQRLAAWVDEGPQSSDKPGSPAAPRDREDRSAADHRAALEPEPHNTPLEDFFDNASDLMQSVSLHDGRFLYVNRTWLTTLGYDRAELATLTVFDLIAPDCRAQCKAIFRELQSGTLHQVDRLEVTFLAKTGQRVLLEGSVNVRRETGLPMVTRAILRDVTEKRRVDQILQEQAAILRIFYESSPLVLGVVELSENDILHTFHNPATPKFFGVEAAALDHRWASEIGIPPEHIQRWLRHYRQSQQQQQPVQFIYEHELGSSHRWLSVVVAYLGLADSGRPRCSYMVQDITARKQLEVEHQRSEALQRQADQVSHELKLLESIVDIILAGYWDWDIAGGREYLSPGFKRMLGYADDELPNAPETWQQLIFPEDLGTVLACFDRHVQSHGAVPYYNEVRYRHKDGSTVWVVCSGQVIEWDAEGNPIRMIGCHFDITERKQTELDLKSANDQLQLVLQASSEGFWDWDLITGDIYFSPQWKAMLGYADHELENSLEMWKSLIFPADLTKALQLIDDYNSDRVNDFTVNQRFHHKNGTVVYVLSRAIHLKDEHGQVVRMVGSHLDMTPVVEMQQALKTSEMQLSGILNSSLDGIMAFQAVRDGQGTITDFEWLLSNPTACQIIGREAHEVLGQRLLEELPGNREEGLFDRYVQVVESGKPMQHEFYYNHDGIDCWFENIAVKLGDGFAVTFRDISAIKQSERQLQQANQLLQDRVDELDQRHSEMLILSEISDFLQACATVEEACNTIVNLVEPLFPHCAGGIFTTSASRTRLEVVATWGASLRSHSEFEPQCCWGLRRGRMHWMNGAEHPRCHHISADRAIAAALCIPMVAQGETLGLFYLSTDNPRMLSEAKQQLARTLTEQVGMVIANLNLRKTLQH
ncbi:hypothetical protein C8255_14170 [filamentous cyanobacterium CCP3]|nr:hypothetical protein C8255_14170 [filamentous cyanobacterium CCP3]